MQKLSGDLVNMQVLMQKVRAEDWGSALLASSPRRPTLLVRGVSMSSMVSSCVNRVRKLLITCKDLFRC